ncbi:mavicyanin-like [Tasmannia lanceolata]|uniref:mavicyanin-like n=1 Tax=Tasmannia lanceolata TaxID=3420 RepID=UPI0040637F3F
MEFQNVICYTFCILFLVNLSFVGPANADVYTVGDDYGWTTGTNYMTWAAKYNFTVGDVLVFNYVKGQHNTYEVSEDTYRSCDSSTGVLEKYDSGNDRVMLKEARNYWFICNIPGHCLGGMRFGVDVKVDNSTVQSNYNPVPASPPSNGAGVPHWQWEWACQLVAFGFWFLLSY